MYFKILKSLKALKIINGVANEKEESATIVKSKVFQRESKKLLPYAQSFSAISTIKMERQNISKSFKIG